MAKTSKVAIDDGLFGCDVDVPVACRLGFTLTYPYTVSMKILTLQSSHFDDVLALNEASIPHVNSIGHDELQWFVDNAACTLVVQIDERFAGFMIGLRPGTAYGSLNYKWFNEHYRDFAYVDRVAVSEWARRRGVAEALYAAFAESEYDAKRITCEVNIEPPNAGSMIFHERQGFHRVGTQKTEGGMKEVALLERLIEQ